MIAAGTKFGPYEISSTLGAGGMGEVYRARDTRLGRDVAIKILPESFSREPERVRRFKQEARTVAALNHPNILAIFDEGSHNGIAYLVSELLEGESLRERLRGGALGPRRVSELALQLAQGLAAAHAKGIIHRDLKPENIFVTQDQRLKILDFGLAKLQSRLMSAGASVQTAESEEGGTSAGTVLGTVGYMAPEQVRGEAADHRADIFAFGAILYEMLSGQRAFKRDTTAETLTAILKDEPAELNNVSGAAIPPAMDRIVRRCLEKQPTLRFQSASDLAFAIESLSASSQAHPVPVAVKRRTSPARLAYVLLILLLAINGAMLLWRQLSTGSASPTQPVRFDRLTDFAGIETEPAISPDGKSVAFVADVGGQREIWVHLMAGGPPLQLTHDSRQHLAPRWSQDSGAILYYSPPQEKESQGAIWEISALGGAPRKLVDSLSEADASHDGTRLAFLRLENGEVQLAVSDRNGLNAQVAGRLPGFTYSHPRWSPDDRWIAYEHASAVWIDDLFVVPASGGEPRKATQERALINGFAWLPDSSGLVYSSARGNTTMYLPVTHLWAQKLRGGAPRQLTFGDAGFDYPDVGRDGRVVAARWRMQFDIWKFPVDGDARANGQRGLRITQQTGQVQTPTSSPDDTEIAFLSDSGGHGNIWVKDLRDGSLRQITHEHDPGVTVGVPIWSPDGSSIAFATRRDLGAAIDTEYWTIHPDGSDLRNPVRHGSWATWSPDSRWLYYADDAPGAHGIAKIRAEAGTPVTVRSDGGIAPMLAQDGTLYDVVGLAAANGLQDYEVRRARPENGPSTLLLRIPAERVPVWQGLHPVISHNGKWLALTLNDDYGTNLWLLSTQDKKLRRAVDFGERRTFIARRVSWSRDDRFLYAAVGEGDADVVLLRGLLP